MVAIGAGAYGVICRTLRSIILSDHYRGMKAYHARQFEAAITHFEASYRYFVVHPAVDRYRSLRFGVASQNPYPAIGLGNMAFCYGQLRKGAKTIQLYEPLLSEFPCHAVARANLNLLKALAPRKGIESTAR